MTEHPRISLHSALACSLERSLQFRRPSDNTTREKAVTPRILSIRLSTSSGPVNILSIYTPTLCSSAETKDTFYEELETTIKEIPTTEHLFLLGDFNAQIEANHNSWPHCIAHFGLSKLNENGQRLLELCSHHDLCISNMFFSTKPCH